MLFVENEEIFGILKSEFSEDCVFCKAGTFRELLRRQKTDPADIVILDLDMTESRTQETVAQLLAYGQNSAILFLADQAVFDASHPLSVLSAVDYVIKPYSRGELLLAMDAAIHTCSRKERSGEEDSLRLSLVRERIDQYIRAHYAEELSMQSVAQEMNYSETHFCRLFKQCFKVNFSAYLNGFRIQQAKEMLCATN